MILLDANILCLFANRADPKHLATHATLTDLRSADERLVTCPQSIFEFMVFATRGATSAHGTPGRPGMGLSPIDARRRADFFLNPVVATFLPDQGNLVTARLDIVVSCHITRQNVHDARYVAFMRTYQITTLCTNNRVDFAPYPGISLVDPVEYAAAHGLHLAPPT